MNAIEPAVAAGRGAGAMACEVMLAGQPWRLLPEHAALWPATATLLLADVHFGKAAAFRARGVPVPQGTTSANLARIDALVERWAVRRIVFLGDLFHARESHAPGTLAALAAWRARRADLDLVLVEGNHDAAAGAPPAALQVRVEREPWRVEGYAFCHVPQRVDEAFAFAGHLHPATRLVGRGGDALRLPCFWLQPAALVLPAFGAFTGGAGFRRAPGDRVIAAAQGRLYEVPAAQGRLYEVPVAGGGKPG